MSHTHVPNIQQSIRTRVGDLQKISHSAKGRIEETQPSLLSGWTGLAGQDRGKPTLHGTGHSD